MVKANLLYNIIEPFSVVLGSRHCTRAYTVLQEVTQPASQASLNHGTGTVLYCRGELSEEAPPSSPFPL